MLRFDIETNGLLDEMTTIHCMVISDGKQQWTFRPHEVGCGVLMLQAAIDRDEEIFGHNIISFDIPAIQKIYPWFVIPRDKRHLVVDTLALSRLIYANVGDWDSGLFKRGVLPGGLIGSHKLEAWGYRLGILKGTYGKQENAWAKFTEEMLSYCEQDVAVLDALIDKLLTKNFPQRAIDLEHRIQWLMCQQERNGFPFDREKAEVLANTLRCRAAVLDAELRKVVPAIPGKLFIPKRDNKKMGYIKDVPIQRYKDFNPKSRQQIEWIVTHHYGYHPENLELYDLDAHKKKTEDEVLELIKAGKCRLKIDDETFAFLKDDKEAPEELRGLSVILEEYLMVSKRLGQCADGKQAWLKKINEKTGCIHGRVNPNGAVSGRATHSDPNIAQVPSADAPYGHECRELFKPLEGWHQVGVDASGLELRCLAHFLYPHDHGAYADTVLNGDIHTVNQAAAGLPSRNLAKRFIYAYLYGAGDVLIGSLIGGGRKEGKKIKRDFLAKTPALAVFKKNIENTLVEDMDKGRVVKWKRKYLKGLDGRPLWVRSLHSALNLLLQSAGALICKYWLVRTEDRLITRGLKHGWDGDFALMAWIHDEQQHAARTLEIADIIRDEAQAAMRDTQEYFKFRVRLDTEGKIGKNWADCH